MPANGDLLAGAKGVTPRRSELQVCSFLANRGAGGPRRLFVKDRTQNGNHEMSEVRSIVIELEVAHDTVLSEIFGDAGFGDAEMVRELRLQRIGAATACASPQQIGDGHAERLASLDVIVRGEIRIAEQQNAGT